MQKTIKIKHIILFFFLAFLISWVLWLPSVQNTRGVKVSDFLLLISNFALLGPAIAAMIVLAITKGKQGIKALFKNAWNWKFKKLWLLVIILLPVVFTSASYFIKTILEQEPIALPEYPMPLWLFIPFQLIAGGPLEEFGWRGFALPQLLKRMPALFASLLLGVLHGLWHLPLRFMTGTVQSMIPFWEFVAVTAVGAVIYTWIYRNTGGNLTAMILFHWTGNLACMFVYYDTMLGRFIFFGIQLIVAVVIVISHSRKWLYKSKSETPHDIIT